MSKNRKRDLSDPAAVDADRTHYMGIGYHIPPGYNAREVHKLFLEWNEKLQKSGHKDIEHYSSYIVGRVSPIIKASHPPKDENIGSQYNIGLVDTYLNYFEQTKPRSAKEAKLWHIDIMLLQSFSAGVDLGSLIRIFNKPTKRAKAAFRNRWPGVTTRDVAKHKGRSKFWIYQRTKTALAHCYAWHLTDINGELTVDDVNFLQLHGIDSKATETIINSALAKVGREPISLKWEKKSY